VKKLEVLLSKTDGGMDSVLVARSSSKIHGSSRASDEIGRHLSTIKDKHRRSLQDERDQCSELEGTEPPPQFPGTITSHSSGFSQRQLESLEKQHKEHIYVLPSYESSSDFGASTDSMSQDLTTQDNQLGLGIITEEKPLPDLPGARPRTGHIKSEVSVKEMELEAPLNKEMGFSFQPGDDTNMLARTDEIHNTHKRMLEDLQKRFTATEIRSETPVITTSTKLSPERSSPNNNLHPESKRSAATSDGASSNLHIHDLPSRGGSTTSVVTAIREHSGRSSVSSSRNESRTGRHHPDRQSGSNEAVTAAARAFAANKNKNGGRKKRTSSMPSDDSKGG
jgi:hypothetical protein